MASHFQMSSPLSRDDLVEALRAEIDSPWTFFGARPVIGHCRTSGFWLCRRTGYRNSFQTILTATLSDDGRGTRLACRAGMSLFVIVFLSVWFGAVVSISLALLPSLLGGDPFNMSVLVVPGMALFAASLVTLGRWLARGEQAYLESFLADVVDAQR